MRASPLQQAPQLQQVGSQQQLHLGLRTSKSSRHHNTVALKQQGDLESPSWPSHDPEQQQQRLPHYQQQSSYNQDQELLWLQQQRLSPHPQQLQARGADYMRSSRQQQQQHPQSHNASLAAALCVTPAQARSMLATYPALSCYNPRFLQRKLQELCDVLGVAPQQLGPALVAAPKVLGYSLQEFERRLFGLTWIQPDRQKLAQMVLLEPLLLTWSAQGLQERLDRMASLLGISSHSLVKLLQQHPQLLPASSHLSKTLQLLQQLLLLAASSEQAGFGTGVISTLMECRQQHSTAQHNRQQYTYGSQPQQQQQQQEQQRQEGEAGSAAAAAARHFCLQHPQLLIVGPDATQAQMASMQAASGLPVAQVAMMVISQPALLLNGPLGAALAADKEGARGAADKGIYPRRRNQQRRWQQQ